MELIFLLCMPLVPTIIAVIYAMVYVRKRDREAKAKTAETVSASI